MFSRTTVRTAPTARSTPSFASRRNAGLAAVVAAAGLSLGLAAPASASRGGEYCQQQQDDSQRPTVQIALLLDTSGSMEGLIEQAKSQLWAIVNQFARAKHGEHRPRLQVALYHYGNDTLSASENYVQMLLPFTEDLDGISAKLFSLRTNGGSEFCGAAIDKATRELSWSTRAKDMRIIVIAGNEPFTQGNLDYRSSIPSATSKNIIINTIFCGDSDEGRRTNWDHGASLGKGTYAVINHNADPAPCATPHDARLSELSSTLNTTYVPYGARGEEGQMRQQAADQSAAGLAPATAAARAVSKSTGLYDNRSWDLVDAVKSNQVKLEEVKDAELPAELRGLDAPGREKKVAELTKKRADIQKEIGELEVKRQAYIEQERAKAGATQQSTLGDALLKAVREQATRQGYQFDEPKVEKESKPETSASAK